FATLVKFYPALVIPAFLRSTEPESDSRSQTNVTAARFTATSFTATRFTAARFTAARFTAVHRFRAALSSRSNLVMLGAFAITVFIVYLPYALSGATGFGSLTSEFHEEGFTGDGVRYFLLALAHKIGP